MTTNDARVRHDDLLGLITTVYREALQDDSLDADSDFFAAGGDSVDAFQITARLSAALGAEISVALVFTYPTPADLASVIELDAMMS